MHWGKRGPGSPSKRRREAYRPDAESLEGRQLLTTFDLTQTQTAPYGVEFVGKASANVAGYTITDVGNITGSGYDSFAIAATGDSITTVGGKPLNPTFSSGGAVYLVFGSKQVNINTVASYLTLANGVVGTNTNGALASGNRAGDLGELGTLGVGSQTNITNPIAQTNPTVFQPQPVQSTTHVYGFNFDGLTFVTGLNTTTGLGSDTGLGYSITPLGDINNSGYDSFAISAPNDTGGGRVFVIYGGPALATQTVANKTIDLEPTPGTISTTTPTKVVSFHDSLATATSEVGYSIAGIGNYFGNNASTKDLAIGAPGFDAGSGANSGAVFTVSGNYINAQSTGANIDLSTLYSGSNSTSANATGGIEYTGFAAGQELGFSVSTAGNFDGTTGTNSSPIDDLLIGAPGLSGGSAYLVYGKQAYLQNQLIGSTQSLSTLGGIPGTNPVTYPLQGAVFGDKTAGDQFGFSVATTGSFNNNGIDDVMIGAPGYVTNTGFVSLIYGLAGTATTTTSTRINGQFVITPTAATAGLTSANFLGTGIGMFTGFSIAPSGHLQIGTATGAVPITDILIGAPGFQGVAYDIPGTAAGATALTGVQMLSATNSTLKGNEFVTTGTSDPAVTTGGFGTSVNARNLVVDPLTGTNTVDPDSIPDLFFGAPYSTLDNPNSLLTPERTLNGVAYVVEGSLIGGTATTTPTTPTTGAASTITTSFNVILNSTAPIVFTGINAGLPSPPISTLSHLDSYAPLPVQIAEQQFRAQPGFITREDVYHNPGKKGNVHQAPAGTVLNVAGIGHSEDKYAKKNTLAHGVFTRGKTRVGKKTTFTHKSKVIPTNLQTETYPG